MTRILVPTTVGVLLALAMNPAFAQQLQQQRPTNQITPLPQNTGVGPQLKPAQSTPPGTIPANPSQRPRSVESIPSTGPSVPAPARIDVKPVEPAARSAPKQVLDERGRLVPGAVQVSPTQAYDPATGRYFQTMPAPPRR